MAPPSALLKGMGSWLLCAVTVASLLPVSSSQAPGCTPASVIYVAPSGSADPCCGATQNSACGSLASALARAASGATISVAGGVYSVPKTLNVTQSSLAVSGPTSGTPASLSCDGGACFSAPQCPAASGCSLNVSGLSLSGGSAASGGCINAVGYSLSAVSLTFRNCSATTQGGAVSVTGAARASFTDVAFDSCSVMGTSPDLSSWGGALFVSAVNTVSLVRVTATACNALGSAYYGFGGAVAIGAPLGAMVSLESCSFSGCMANFEGGALYTANVTVQIVNSNFSNSMAFMGGAYYDTNSSVTIDGCTFRQCSTNASLVPVAGSTVSYDSGGCVDAYMSASLTVSSSQFLSCYNGFSGGGLYAYLLPVPVTITDCLFNDGLTMQGGGIMFDTCTAGGTVSGTNFTSNKAWSFSPLTPAPGYPTFGSAVTALSSPVNFSGCHFLRNNNSGYDPSGMSQGQAEATLQYQSLTDVAFSVAGCVFEDNVVDGPGGGIWADSGNLTISDCVFRRNSVLGTGAGVLGNGNTVVLRTLFEDNWGTGEGSTAGGAALQQVTTGTLYVEGSTFSGNFLNAGNGGALFGDMNLPVTVKSTKFFHNYVLGQRGGAVEMLGSTLTLEDCAFFNNSAVGSGGALSILGTGLPYTITRCNFSANVAGLGSGAIYSSASTKATITGCKFVGNKGALGAAIQMQEFSDLTIEDSECNRNQASLGGGCLSLAEKSTVTVTDTELYRNEATAEGGGVRVSGLSTAVFTRTNIEGNTAQWGAGFWTEMESVLSIFNSTVTSNAASFQAGAIYCGQNSTVILSNDTVAGNTGPQGGAVVVTAIASLAATNTSFIGNSPSAVVSQGFSTLSCTGCHFENNSNVAGTGGALSASDEPRMVVADSRFVANVASEGGAVFAKGSSALQLDSCLFANNSAQVGAAVALFGSTNASISSSTFFANKASSAGGGVAVMAQANGELVDTNFTQNYAVGGGAGVYILRTNTFGSNISAVPFVVSHLSFAGNVALQDGGGAYMDATEDPEDRTTCLFCSTATPSDTLATVPADLDLTWPGSRASFKSAGSFTIMAAVGAPIEGLVVTILDYYGNNVTSDNASVALVSPDYRISGLLRGTSVRGVVAIPPINVQVSPTSAVTFNLTITVQSPGGAFADFSRPFYVSFCAGGEFYEASSFSCQPCPVGSWCAPGQPVQPCPSGTFSFYPGAASVDQCAQCSDSALTCENGNLTMGYQNWLDFDSLNSTPTTYPCFVTNGCPGLGQPSPYTGDLYLYTGPNTTQCETGYSTTVPTCGLCAPGYFFVIGYCETCTTLFRDVFFVLLAVVVIAWVVMVVMANNFLCVDNFLNEVQLIVLIGSTNLNFPPNAMWMMRILQLYNLSVFDPDLIGPQCWVNYSFQERFYVSLAIPLAGLAIYALAFLRHKYMRQLFVHVHSYTTEAYGKRVLERSLSTRRESSDYNNSIIHACTNWLDICYILVLTRILAVFGPQTIGDTTVVALAPQIVWFSPEHIAMFAVGLVYGLIYLVGLPAFYIYWLTQAKKHDALDTTEFKQKYGWLTERYKRRFWWWHLTNIVLRVIHAAVLVFLIESTNIQVVIYLPIQALRIAMQWKSSALASLSLDYLQAALTLGEFMFTFSLVAYNYMNLQLFSEILYGISTALILVPFCFVFAYEAINKHLELRNNQMLSKMWKVERNYHKHKFANMDPYDLVDLHEVSEWFRPHIISALLSSKGGMKERQLLLKVRDRVQYCKLRGLANVDWVNHLKKPQLYAVLSQALLGASAGHITVAKIPRNGFFCKEHGVWHSNEECTGMHQHENQPHDRDTAPAGMSTDQTPAPGLGMPAEAGGPPTTPPPPAQLGRVAAVAWPETLERHISWNASHTQSMDFDQLSRDRSISRDPSTLQPSASARHADAALLGHGSPAPSSTSGTDSTPMAHHAGAHPAAAGAGGGGAGSSLLTRAPSIRVQNLKVNWGGARGAATGAEGTTSRQEAEGEQEFVEAKMNMTELTLTFQRHLSLLVHSEKKKKEDSLRLVIRSEYIPIILSWLTSASSTQDDQKLLRRLVVGLREVAIEESGGLGWWKGILRFCRNWSLRPNYRQEVEASGEGGQEPKDGVPTQEESAPLTAPSRSESGSAEVTSDPSS